MDYSQEQIAVAKILIRWLRNKGVPHEIARKETIGLLKRSSLKRLRSKMTQATSLEQLKGMLDSRKKL
jgi:hypothetical protein